MHGTTMNTALWTCCGVECISTIVLVTTVAFRGPDNHVSVDPRWFGIAAVPAIIAIVLGAGRRSSATPMLTCGLATLIFVVALILVDQLNLLVQYDEWVRRGMPPSPLQ